MTQTYQKTISSTDTSELLSAISKKKKKKLLYAVKTIKKNCSNFSAKRKKIANNLSQGGSFIDRVKINKQKDYTLLQ